MLVCRVKHDPQLGPLRLQLMREADSERVANPGFVGVIRRDRDVDDRGFEVHTARDVKGRRLVSRFMHLVAGSLQR